MKTKFILIISIFTIINSSLTACFGLDDPTLKVLQNAISELAAQPGRWEAVLSNLERQLTTDVRTTITHLKKEMLDFTEQVIEYASIETRCNADFIGRRVQNALQQMVDKITNKEKADYSLSPWVCHVRPNQFTVDQNGYVPKEEALITVTGFGFTNDNASNVMLYVVDQSNKILEPIHRTSAFSTDYQILINVQGLNFQNVAGNKLRAEWSTNKDDPNKYTEVVIMQAATPTIPLTYQLPAVWGDPALKDIGFQLSHHRRNEELSPSPPARDQAWCDPGSYIVQLWLEGAAFDVDHLENGLWYPIISRAICRQLKTNAGLSANWDNVFWQSVGYDKSRNDIGTWCPEGTFIVGLDLDAPDGAMQERPYVGQSLCARPSGNQFTHWTNRTSQKIWYERSMNGVNSTEWCPSGSFLIQLKLDIGGDNPTAQPFVGWAYCASPAP